MLLFYKKTVDSLLLALYCLFIYYLSDQPVLPTPMLFSHQDKLFHAGAYFILAAFTLRALRHVTTSFSTLILLSLTFASLYGLADEWHQSFVPNRMSDVADWLADTFGAMLFLAGYYGFRKRVQQPNK